MFGGRATDVNTISPGFVKDNCVQIDDDTLSQLQLFAHAPIYCGGTSNYTSNLHASAHHGILKRVRKGGPDSISQNLFVPSNMKSTQEVGRIRLLPNSVSTGLRLSCEENSSVTSASENLKTVIPGIPNNCLRMMIDQQTEEFEGYIKLQEENILKGIRELNQRHTASLLNTLDKGITRKLQEKELEIENITRKNKEMGDEIKRVSVEAQSWHHRASYSESVVNVLKCNIQRLIAQGPSQSREGFGDSEVDDAISGTNLHGAISGSNRQVFQIDRLKCKLCKSKEVSLLLLPCRHLCLCMDCEVFAAACPVCRVTKTASIAVYL